MNTEIAVEVPAFEPNQGLLVEEVPGRFSAYAQDMTPLSWSVKEENVRQTIADAKSKKAVALGVTELVPVTIEQFNALAATLKAQVAKKPIGRPSTRPNYDAMVAVVRAIKQLATDAGTGFVAGEEVLNLLAEIKHL